MANDIYCICFFGENMQIRICSFRREAWSRGVTAAEFAEHALFVSTTRAFLDKEGTMRRQRVADPGASRRGSSTRRTTELDRLGEALCARVHFDGVDVGPDAAVGSAEQTPALIIVHQTQIASRQRARELQNICTKADSPEYASPANTEAGRQYPEPDHLPSSTMGKRSSPSASDTWSAKIVSRGGGGTEIARTLIAERVEPPPGVRAADRGVRFSAVRRGR
jgi:hypothetical protein